MKKQNEPHYAATAVIYKLGDETSRVVELARTLPCEDAAGTYIPDPLPQLMQRAAEVLAERTGIEGDDHINLNDVHSIVIARI
jgi:hypothetical protein